MNECGVQVFSCQCVKPEGHVDQGDDVHVCIDRCGSSWRGEDEQTMSVVSFPFGWLRNDE